tara:strand:+ start:1491 stop:1745 length:255 start_codon:yes stop_codon:yes gene_type:complete
MTNKTEGRFPVLISLCNKQKNSKVLVQPELRGIPRAACHACHHSRLGVLADTALKKIRLALQTDQRHKLKRVLGVAEDDEDSED